LATAGAGTWLAAGGDAIASCAGVAADAAFASWYSHAEPIVGARPNRASAVPITILFMDHLLSLWTSGEICAYRARLSTTRRRFGAMAAHVLSKMVALTIVA
jgi:hypothetical protein